MQKTKNQNHIFLKQHKKKSKSQDTIVQSLINQINLSIYLSHDQQINIPVPIKCPLKIINSIISHKVSQYKKQPLIGFQSIPSNYSFDYRLKKNIGCLSNNKNITLNCLYRNSSLDQMIKKEQQLSNGGINLDVSTFYKINKYKICKPLSSGGFSRVYLVRNLLDGQFYAAKFMEKSSHVNIQRAEAIKNQFFIHKSLQHPYIVKMEQFIQTQQFFILIMEYCPGGQLFTLLKNNRYMEEEKAKLIFLQVLLAIRYLHHNNIVFRDIKPENILIDQKGNAKLTDFGLAKEIRDKTNSYCGSVEYMAPEIVSKQYYSFDIDLYCMGALLYQILIGCPPFYNPNFTTNQTKYHICNSEVCFPNKVHLSQQVRDLIASLLIKNPNQRLGHTRGVQQILQHEWIGDTCIQTIQTTQVQCPFVPNLQIQNFDRQQDDYQQQFRQKIFIDMNQCKRLCASVNVCNKFQFNSKIKNKSISVGCPLKKHVKSKSQQQFTWTSGSFSKNVSPLKITNSFNIQESFNKSNPYKFVLGKKDKNEFTNDSINNKSSKYFGQNNKKNSIKKLSSHHRSLSRSMSKNAYKDTFKQQIKSILQINTKSYSNSRKNSLHKASNQKSLNKNQTDSNFLMKKTELIYLKNSNKKQMLFKKSNKKPKDFDILTHNVEKNKIKPQNGQAISQVKFKDHSQQMVHRSTLNFQRQNTQNSKQLKRKNIINKKNLFFASNSSLNGIRSLKNSQFLLLQNQCNKISNIQSQKQNRQTVM